jgi:2-dehydro-3-deoxy-D-arabinonate dehydratase
MNLTRHLTPTGPRWAIDTHLLPADFSLGRLLELPQQAMAGYLRSAATGEPAAGAPLAPLDPEQEVWAAGVTYLRSRDAREAESTSGDIYQRVYTAERPELFFKAPGWRVIPPGGSIRVRCDSLWNVPEPELTVLINCHGEPCGYTAGNDVSSRSIEGENPLYLPQAKVYNGACALGPSICLVDDYHALHALPIRLTILRGGAVAFQGETGTHLIQRDIANLAGYLFRELDFPRGAFLMTGTGIVPPESFSLQPGDEVRVEVGDLLLQNITA